ncbi:hypothetical protein [Paenibacillus radicis (ex Xue et al. 2023)]|uniref:DUF1080 domain-containing protein n=1 Tax=Paenibacillus radicis (ex Xue et al. 2023) TaxID=2972489 RepID=A0ABT1YEE6_9BACL|nr:hypothetical protein [Paenibacillus radicis (ex Xue et al. 2023)]MCR8631287.1 hypothetical protein [Paenibacillus radicis (ex Xue et al. 2023)]
MRNQIARVLCFMLLLNALFGGGMWVTPASAADIGSLSSVADSVYDPVTVFNKDFTQAFEGQSASQLGFDYSTLSAGEGSANVEVDPVTNEKALHLSVKGAGSGVEFQISKTFSETLTGTISTEITFMQKGTTKMKDRILLFSPPGGGATNLINAGLDASKGIVYFPDTAPTDLATPYNLNQWYTMRIELNTVTKKFSIWVDGKLIKARQNTNNVNDLKKISIATPAATGDLYVRGIKVTRIPFNPYPKAPLVTSVVGRNTKIAFFSESYTWASKYRWRIKEKGQADWLNFSATANYTENAFSSNIIPGPSASSYYDPIQKKSVPLTNGKTYVIGFSVVTRDELNKIDYEGEIFEFEGTPYASTPLSTPDSSVIGTVTAYSNYNANQWSINSGMNIGDLTFADKTIRFTSIPAKYTSMDWIRTTQADTMTYPNAADGTAFPDIADFTVKDDATVYVAVDILETTLPLFLSDWTDTGDTIQMSDAATAYLFKIYKKDFASGKKVTMGYNNYMDFKAGKNAGYFVMVKRTAIGLTLDPIKEWVNSPSYSLTGSISDNVYSKNVTLSVYQNQSVVSLYKDFLPNNKFKVNLSLLPGANLIEVYAARDNSTLSEKSTAVINYDVISPDIRISTPPATVKDAVYTIQGSVSKSAKLTVKHNGIKVADSVVKAAYEPFSYPLNLAEGSNQVEISSVDLAGNVRTVNYLISYMFWAGQAATYDLNGNLSSALSPSKDILAQRKVTNSSASAKQITLWFVLYDGNNSMLNYSSVIADFEPGETKTLITGFTLPTNVTGYHMKAFIWDSLNGMKPLSDEVQLQ